MNRFEGQIVVVTGASRGIGHERALSFAREGADVACISRSQANSDKIAEEIRALGRKAWAYALDVSDTNAVAEMSAALLKEAGKGYRLIRRQEGRNSSCRSSSHTVRIIPDPYNKKHYPCSS